MRIMASFIAVSRWVSRFSPANAVPARFLISQLPGPFNSGGYLITRSSLVPNEPMNELQFQADLSSVPVKAGTPQN